MRFPIACRIASAFQTLNTHGCPYTGIGMNLLDWPMLYSVLPFSVEQVLKVSHAPLFYIGTFHQKKMLNLDSTSHKSLNTSIISISIRNISKYSFSPFNTLTTVCVSDHVLTLVTVICINLYSTIPYMTNVVIIFTSFSFCGSYE
jgi:hypothetical protein